MSSSSPIPSDLLARVAKALRFLDAQRGKPYFYGAEGPDSFDCSGLYRQTLLAGADQADGVRPVRLEGPAGLWPMKGDADVAELWTASAKGQAFERVDFADRQPLDAIVFGLEEPHHLVVVAAVDRLVGANSGGPPWALGTPQQEPEASYVARMASRGARVKETSADYWQSQRVGIIRPAALIGVDLKGYARTAP